MRRALHRGRWLRVGYAEAVAVRADVRRRGLGGQVMGALERYVDGGYDFGALCASAAGSALYVARGWELWPGRVSALGPAGVSTCRKRRATSSSVPPLPVRSIPRRGWSSTGGTAT